MYGTAAFLYTIFLMISWVVLLYTINFFYLSYMSRNNVRYEKKRAEKIDLPSDLPQITVQLPLYNEKYVARRLIDAVCRIDYPKDKLEIQVLDDSDDDTVDLIQSIVKEYRIKGFDIVHLHRTDRTGYKAGALKAGLKSSKGEFVAIFDADFIPPAHFLRHLLKYFNDPKMGFVQCKWGHINEDFSSLTGAQAVSLDLHFLVEQKAKSFTHFFMNFNGTAGIWRRSCIDDAGGWHTTTLVEDMDLSYRAHMRGWQSLFLDDIVVDAELPVQMNAAKRQQYRWAKGAMQVALKLLADVIMSRRVPPDTKLQSFIHMTRHIVNPLFLAQFLIFPMLLAMDFKLYTESWAPFLVIGTYIGLGPGGYLAVINRTWKHRWKKKAWQFFFLNFFAAGITVNNTVAVFDAVLGKKNEFLRTPKFGVVKKNDDWRGKEYVLPFTKTTLLEIFFAVYGTIAVFISILSGNPLYAPMIAIPTVGFIYTAYLSIAHSSSRKRRARPAERAIADAKLTSQFESKYRTSKSSHRVNQRMVLTGLVSFIVLGGAMVYYGYYSTIYPLNEAIGYLIRAQSSQTPEQLAEYIGLAKGLLPKEGNPVWLFQTARTDFGTIQETLADMQERAENAKAMSPHSTSYNVAMIDMHETAGGIQENVIEAMPFMYITAGSVAVGGAWVATIIAVFAAMRIVNEKTKARYEQQFKTA